MAILTPASLRSGILAGLLGPGAPLAAVDNTRLEALILETEAAVEDELSTRFTALTFRGCQDVSARPVLPEGEEVEGAYDWPARIPGNGFPVFMLKVRPVAEILRCQLRLPGGIGTPIDVPLTWFRLDALAGEATIAPNAIASPMLAAGLASPLVGLLGGRLPEAVLFDYKAGMDTKALARFPQVKRLVEMRTAILFFAEAALRLDPFMLTSMSADGLSQSRSSGFAFKDMEDRFRKEAEDLKASILALWEGPDFAVL